MAVHHYKVLLINLVEWSDTWKLAFKGKICTVTRKRAQIIHDYIMGTALCSTRRSKEDELMNDIMGTLRGVDDQRDLEFLITCDAGFIEHMFA